MNLSQLPVGRYEAAAAFVFSRPFQDLTARAAAGLRFPGGVPVVAVLAGIAAHAREHGRWPEVLGFIAEDMGWDGSGADHPGAAAVRETLERQRRDREADDGFAQGMLAALRGAREAARRALAPPPGSGEPAAEPVADVPAPRA